MEEFLNRLYSYEYFGTYLMISIAVLILLFIIILFFGKKDQKNREIEATKKLQQINNEDAFKEEDNKEKIEISKVDDDTLSNEKNDNDIETLTAGIPNVINEEMNNREVISVPEISNDDIDNFTMNEEVSIPDLPVFDNNNIENVELNTINENINEEDTYTSPVLQKEEEKPFVFDDSTDVVNKEINTENDQELEDNDISDIPSVPEFNFDEIIRGVEEKKEDAPKKEEVKEVYKAPEIFSSVFVKEDKKEEKVNEVVNNYDDEDEEEMELPTLKSEMVEEAKEIELPSLNDLSGESYEIK